jgi:hypothetical protein
MRTEKQPIAAWYKVSLRLFSQSYLPEQLTKYLGFKPTLEAIKGSHFRGNPKYGKYKTHLWLYSVTKDSSVPFEKQLIAFFKKLGPRKAKLKALLKKPDIRGDLFLGFSSQTGMGGAELGPNLLKEIATIGLPLSLDLYPKNLYDKKDLSQYRDWIDAYFR